MQILVLLQTAFTIWMLVDAISRKAEYYWWAIIFFVPFGSYIYFFMVKIKDPSFSKIKKWFTEKPVTIDQLRYEAGPVGRRSRRTRGDRRSV